MGMLETKRDAIAARITKGAPAPGGFLAMLLQFLKSLMGGLSICHPTPAPAPAPAEVHDAITNPTPEHQVVMKRTARRELRRARLPSSLEYPIVQATVAEGAICSKSDTDAMWKESRGQ
jgi:hypothetical protein